MKKKDKVIIIALMSVVLLVVGWNVAKKVIRERNVFDEMYYSRVHRIYIDWYGAGGNFRTMFSNMPQMEGVSRDSEMIHTQEGVFFEHYKEGYLDENENVQISFFIDDREMYIDFSCEDEDGYKWYVYCYYVADKVLVYDSNDPDNTERKKFLYEIFLPDWFEANEGVSHYSMDNLGKFTFRDDTVEE